MDMVVDIIILVDLGGMDMDMGYVIASFEIFEDEGCCCGMRLILCFAGRRRWWWWILWRR